MAITAVPNDDRDGQQGVEGLPFREAYNVQPKISLMNHQSVAPVKSQLKRHKSNELPEPKHFGRTSLAKASLGNGVLVCPFNDHRKRTTTDQGKNPQADSLHPSNDIHALNLSADLIIQLFISALKRAGYNASAGLGGARCGHQPAYDLLLEGEVWNFGFETRATTVLEVDLSLALLDGADLTALWRYEFPSENFLPLWISLGCRPQEMLGAALREVEEAALERFKTAEFRQAAGLPAISSGKLSTEDEASHEVVYGSSWTGAEKTEPLGKEPDSVAAGEVIPTAAWYEPSLAKALQ